MRDARREDSPYPKADLTLRGLARLADFAVAFALGQASPQLGPVLAAFYLLVADGLMHREGRPHFRAWLVGKIAFVGRGATVEYRFRNGNKVSFVANELDVPTLLNVVKDYVASKCLLFVLDTFEHLVDTAPMIAELLATAPHVKVLVTSRRPLHLGGETEYLVSPLAAPDPGASLPVIGKSLGHKQHATTMIYSRINLDPVRASVTTATQAILAAAKKKPTQSRAKVKAARV